MRGGPSAPPRRERLSLRTPASRLGVRTVLLFFATLTLVRGSLSAHEQVTTDRTFHRDIAPLLERHCGRCHREAGAAPFVASSWADVRPRAVAIKEAILERRMPPFWAEGIERDGELDAPLAASDIDAIVEWASGGAPRGEPPTSPSPAPSSQPPLDSTTDVVLELAAHRLVRDGALEVDATASWPVAGPFRLRGFIVESARPELVRGVTLWRGTPRPEAFLGAWTPGELRPELARLPGAWSLAPGEALLARVVYARPWTLGDEEPSVVVRLRCFVLPEDAAAPLLRSLPLPTGGEPGALGGEPTLLWPTAPLRLLDVDGSPSVEVFRVDPGWPRAYRIDGLSRDGFVALGLPPSARDESWASPPVVVVATASDATTSEQSPASPGTDADR